MDYLTADLSDRYAEGVAIVEGAFCDYGGHRRFHGEIETVKAFEDNSRVRECLSEPGAGKVLVIDGGASMRCAMLGDMLAKNAVANGWAGVVVNGCIRDSAEIAVLPIGVKALGAHPRKTEKRGLGKRNVPVSFGGVTFLPGHYLYADEDGILVSENLLEPSGT